MLKRLLALAFAVALLAAPQVAFAASGYEQGKVLVVFNDLTTRPQANRAVLATQSVEDGIVCGKVAKLDVAEGSSVEEAIADLEGNPAVAYAQPNYLYELLDVPAGRMAAGTQALSTQMAGTNDPLRYQQWYLSAINAYESWDHAKADGKVTVAILDTGITMDHADLKGRIVAPYDVVGDARSDYTDSVPDDSPDDEAGHGTHVAGIVAAEADNGVGTAGVSYNANIMPMRVCYYSDYAGTYITSSEDLAAAYAHLLSTADSDVNGNGRLESYAVEYNVRVANMSLGALWQPGTPEEEAADRAVLDLVDRADAEGVLTVCAAGNDNSDAYSWPSDHDTCVSVIALDQYDNRASYSNYGKDKDIAAPGSDIFSTVPISYALQGVVVRDSEGGRHCYAEMTGTSMASPVVAGVAAQVFAANPNLTCDEAKKVLYTTATDLGDAGFDNQFGNGKVNAAAAVQAAAAQPGTWEGGSSSDGEESPGAVTPSKTIRVTGLASSYPFTGKPIKPALAVKMGKVKLKRGTDYKLTYRDNVNVGMASVEVVLTRNLTGSTTLPFSITPVKVPAVSGVRAVASGTGVSVSWKALAKSKASGYQVRYSPKANMARAKVKTVKSPARSALSIKVAGKSCYVQVRAFKVVGSTTFRSAWTKPCKTSA